MEIGAKIRDLRKANNLTLEELASRTELSKGFLSQLERDLTTPSIDTLQDILLALGSSLAAFFREETDQKVVFCQEDFFMDEKENYSIEWIVPNAQGKEMEPILITIQPKKQSVTVTNHQGEEFGYVLKGPVYIEMEDGTRHKANTGETFYLEGSQSHHLYNPSKSIAQVLWVSTPPIF